MKTVIVTGAGSGIGKAIAERFYHEGQNIVLVGRTESKLLNVSAEWDKERFINICADVSSEEDVNRAISATIKRFDHIDILVNNAGIAKMDHIDNLDIQTWKLVQDVNSTGVFLMSKAAMPYLSKSNGNIINISSVSGLGGDWGGFAYNASKGAVSNFTRALALDYKNTKVRVNAIAPSFTDTDMGSGIKENENLYNKFMERIPIGRPGKPKEMANAVYFLSSEEANFINGVILPIDGGLSASNGQPPLN